MSVQHFPSERQEVSQLADILSAIRDRREAALMKARFPAEGVRARPVEYYTELVRYRLAREAVTAVEALIGSLGEEEMHQ